MRTTVARRAIAGVALAVGLPLAVAGVAAAQSAPSGPGDPSAPGGPSGPSGPSAPPAAPTSATTQTTIATTSTTQSSQGLPRTGVDAALPLAASAVGITVVLGTRRLAARRV